MGTTILISGATDVVAEYERKYAGPIAQSGRRLPGLDGIPIALDDLLHPVA